MTGLSEPIGRLQQPAARAINQSTVREEMHSVPPPNAAPGRVLFVSGQSASAASRPLQLAGHEVFECQSLRGLCMQLKYQQPDAICVEAGAAGPLEQALRIIRGRHTSVPIILLTEDANPGLTPVRYGYYSTLSHPVETEQLIVQVAHAIAHHRMLRRIQYLEVESARKGFAGIHGTSAFARRLFRKLLGFANADVHALLVGEEGTGKSLAARAIHDHSARARGPFIALSCERLSDTAFSASAFVNASMGSPSMRQHGALDDADRGTLFLSNIDRLSPHLQTQLLSALSDASPCDFRLIASTAANLNERVNQGAFRSELLAHLAHAQLHLLPLRSRPTDISAIGQAILDESTKEQGKPRITLSLEAIDALEQHRFTRNVSELKQVLSSALTTTSGTLLKSTALPAMLQAPGLVGRDLAERQSVPPDSGARRRQVLFEILAHKPMKIRDLERCAIEATLQRTGDNVTQAMRELGIGRTTLYRKLKKYGRR